MDVSAVLELLRNKIGLNPNSIGTASVEKAVRERIEMSGAASVEDYVQNLSLSSAELNGLVESVLIRETSFFRNRTPFIALRSYLQQFVLGEKSEGPLRILCLPCSTGEEAYTIAMVLFDMKLTSSQFSILAGDISEPVLRIAEAGSYSAYSFRGGDMAFKRKYFAEQPGGAYLLKEEVRDTVRFEQINILDDKFQLGVEPYDVIFCRNLLIYFDAAAKSKAIKALANHLSDKGVLFVGHAEGPNVSPFGFTGLDYPMSFAFARTEYANVINAAINISSPIKRDFSPFTQAPRYALKTAVSRDAGKTIPVATHPGKNVETARAFTKSLDASDITVDISAAQQLADAGSFREAEAICEKLLSDGVESAEVYYLLGQAACSTEDNLMAEEYLRKAIYLEADFHDALICLSNLFERMGNPEKAASFRRRAQRVKLREEEGGK